MNPSTASNRLVKDILYDFVVKANHRCFHCGEELSRDTFSIEHKIPWLHSEDPLELFFDLGNIAFSHLRCNIGAARQPNKKYFSEEERVEAANRLSRARYVHSPEKRREKYLRLGT